MRMTGVVCLAVTVIVPGRGNAQTPAATGRLLVTVVDQTGAVLPTATSPFYGQPTNVMNPRKLQAGLRFGF